MEIRIVFGRKEIRANVEEPKSTLDDQLKSPGCFAILKYPVFLFGYYREFPVNLLVIKRKVKKFIFFNSVEKLNSFFTFKGFQSFHLAILKKIGISSF